MATYAPTSKRFAPHTLIKRVHPSRNLHVSTFGKIPNPGIPPKATYTPIANRLASHSITLMSSRHPL